MIKYQSMSIVLPIKTLYKNIKGVGKVKELTSDKFYECRIEKKYGMTFYYLINDLGIESVYTKKSMFQTLSQYRDKKVNQIL